jgi:AcrR family transcriptional regulator
MGQASAPLPAPDGRAPHARAARVPEWGVPPRQRLTRDEKKAQTRERLLDAASKVFARKGFASTSVDEVAEEAGVTKGAVYSNFDSKEDLVRAVLDERLERRFLDIAEQAPSEGSLADDAVQASRQFGSVLEQERDAVLLGLEFAIYAVRNPEFRDDFIAHHRNAQADIARVVGHRLTEGGNELRVPAATLASMFNAISNGVALERLMDPGSVSDEMLGLVFAAVAEAFTDAAGSD